jgi:NADH-quinone oxidoreductase subunit H
MSGSSLPLALELLLMPLIAFVVGLALVLMMRWVRARIEGRVGAPLLQPVYDIFELGSQQARASHGPMHSLSLAMLLGGFVTAGVFLPVPGMDGLAGMGDLITLVCIMMAPTLGLAVGAGSGARTSGSTGISRALAAMLVYDVPFVITVVGASLAYGSTNLVDIAHIQQSVGLAGWGATTMPLLALAGLVAMCGMLGKEPFQIHLATAGMATGPMVEMSSKYVGALLVMQSFQLYIVGVLYMTLFLGGGESWPACLAKLLAVVLVLAAAAGVLSRYRADAVIRFMWKWPTLVALAGLALVMAR